MTCKDCVHYERCQWFADWLKKCGYGVEFDDDSIAVDKTCLYFKNKADFVEVKHGEWRISNRKEVYICSNCKKAVPFVLICTEPYKIEYDFCPHCGADMRKEGADNGK